MSIGFMLWHYPKIFPILQVNQVHIWRASIVQTAQELPILRELLNSEEKERADKFLVQKAANNFIMARGFLRKLLANYLKVTPQEITFQQNQYGKLYLNASRIQFNLSHSHDLILFIFALDTPVGIDVELIQENYDFSDIAEKFFSKEEKTRLFSLPKEEQLQAFFNCWTRKEAFIKAKGVGMFTALDKFSVEITSNKEEKAGINDFSDTSNIHDWTLESINPGDMYAGAFVINSRTYTTKLLLEILNRL